MDRGTWQATQSTASESDMTEHSPTKKLLWGFLGHMTFSDSTGKFTTGYTTYDCVSGVHFFGSEYNFISIWTRFYVEKEQKYFCL